VLALPAGEARDPVGADHLLPAMEADALIAGKAFDSDVRVLELLAALSRPRGSHEPHRRCAVCQCRGEPPLRCDQAVG
jgi:hypothetical protein